MLLVHLNCISKRNFYETQISKKILVDRHISKLFPRFYGDYPPHKIITLPNLSPTMETGSVLSWGRLEGEAVSEGDLLAEIETDKATMSMDASDNGIMAKILVQAGTKDIPIGTPLCVIVENESDVSAFKNYTSSSISSKPSVQVDSKPTAPSSSQPSPASPIPLVTPVAASSTMTGDRLFASPYSKTLAAERGIDLATLANKGSGPGGRIRATDLDQVIPSVGVKTVGTLGQIGASYTDVDISNIRKVIAQRLCLSKQTIPHYHLTKDVCVDHVLELRAKLNKRDEKTGSKLSLNDFVIKAAAVACMRVIECNSSWQNNFIRQYNQVDVNIAVATPYGLITPLVYNADTKGLKEINKEIALLATKAREGKLQPHEFQSGTFTISNLGMFGISNFSAIVNPPQSCILAVGGSQERLVINEKSDTGFSKATYMSVTLSCDHRVVDGSVGANWLKEFTENIEDPANMLL